MRIVEIVILAGIVLALFGPKTLQTLARSAGKGVGQAKDVKDQVLSEIPLDDITRMKNHLSNVPLSPQQAVQKLITSELKRGEKDDTVKAAPNASSAVVSTETKAE